MGYIQGANRNQMLLMPENLEEYISCENPVRVIDAFVNTLDLLSLGFSKTIPAKEGRPAYNPSDLLKLYIYGYFNRLRSSRRLGKECVRNVELMWLLGKLTPDFRTISDFRKDNVKALKEVFRRFTKICLELDLFGKELLAVDGSKFKAVNANNKSFTGNMLKDRVQKIQARLDEYFAELDKNDADENDAPEYTKEELEEKIKGLTELRQRYSDYLENIKENKQNQISLTDPEARIMRNNGKIDVCFNVQTAVDDKAHMIADFLVTNAGGDKGLLTKVVKQAKSEIDAESLSAVADKGYQSSDDILDCLMNGIIPHVPMREGRKFYEYDLPFEESVITDDTKNSAKPEDIEKCIKSGVVPSIFENAKNISIEKITTNEMKVARKVYTTPELNEDDTADETGYANPYEIRFVRDLEKDIVICPQGEILRRKAFIKRYNHTTYYSRAACKKCSQRCTASSGVKVVAFKGEQTVYLGKYSRHTTKKKPIKIKPKKVFVYETVPIPERTVVRIVITADKEIVEKRKCLSEHPFGTIKHYDDAGYLLLKGIEKVTGELSLSFLAYNLKRAMNVAGVDKIMRKLQTA